MRKKLIPHYLLNVVVLAFVLGVFVLSDAFAHESGLLAVVVMGMVLGNSNLPQLKELLYFKESLSVLLISILFILLSANINMKELMLIYNWKTLSLFAVVVFFVRPLGVFLSTMNSTLKFNEKLFISWVGPRGIVAAGIASLFGLKLAKEGIYGAEYITPLVFMIVLGTVLLNATTARFFAKIVGVFLKKSEGILIIGASEFSRTIAQYFDKIGKQVVLIDSNKTNIEKAMNLGLEALNVDIYSDELVDNIELNNIGYLIALTGNTDINKYAINNFKNNFGENGAYRIPSKEEIGMDNLNKELFSCTNDFVSLTEVAEKSATIYEVTIETKEAYHDFINMSKDNNSIIPLFLKHSSNELDILTNTYDVLDKIEKGTKLVYLGEKFKSNIIENKE
jgi:Trk K+ transport system NAD-binding subunit